MLKKLLFIYGSALFCLVNYLFLFQTNWTIRYEKISTEKRKSPRIAGFYHFLGTGNNWKSIVNEQITIAHLSGLIKASSNIYVTGLGKIIDNENITDLFANSKFVCEYIDNPKLYEYPTLQKLENFCLHNTESFVWYAHSKGASHPVDDAAAWRHVMNHFVLDKWQLCYGLLFSTNYTTCGAILTLDGLRKPGWNTYYAGNMWWAKCSHINRLTRIEKLDKNDRYIAELYVTSEPDVGHFNCFFANVFSPFKLNKQNASCTINQPMWKIR
jgi:hypothetical protein